MSHAFLLAPRNGQQRRHGGEFRIAFDEFSFSLESAPGPSLSSVKDCSG